MTSFKTEFAVELHCEACVKTVKEALSKQQGVENYEISLKDQRVVVEGHAAPSQIARALKKDGRQVIVRGTGVSANDDDGAAVCIFESYTPLSAQEPAQSQQLHGLARLVQAGKTTILDLTIKHEALAKQAQAKGRSTFEVQSTSSSALPSVNGQSSHDAVDGFKVEGSTSSFPTNFGVYVAKTGDISDGAASSGGVFRELGQLQLRKKDGYGDLFTEFNNLNIWDIIGRAMVIAPIEATIANGSVTDKAQATKLGPGILAGVIARSAGTWSNDKSVCTCSGQTQWEEARASKF